MYTVNWIDNTSNTCKTFGSYARLDDAVQSIYDWFISRGAPHLLYRQWTIGDVTTIDYGSYHCFYKIVRTDSDA